MKKYENDNITVQVCGYPRCCSKPTGKTVRVCTCTHTGMGFTGTGPGWTLPTRAIPVCHPKFDTVPVPMGPARQNLRVDLYL